MKGYLTPKNLRPCSDKRSSNGVFISVWHSIAGD
jgi:hypothetical protein